MGEWDRAVESDWGGGRKKSSLSPPHHTHAPGAVPQSPISRLCGPTREGAAAGATHSGCASLSLHTHTHLVLNLLDFLHRGGHGGQTAMDEQGRVHVGARIARGRKKRVGE